METCCEKIVRNYIDRPVTEVKELTGGHINETFLIKAEGFYILQRLCRGLYTGFLKDIEHNYLQYRKACKMPDAGKEEWYCPEWMRTGEGNFFYSDKDGDIWRMYRYIEGDAFDERNGTSGIYEAGRGLGRLHSILEGCNGILRPEPFAHLHDIDFYYKKYIDLNAPYMIRIEELDRTINKRINEMRSITVPSGSVIHGDAKVGNMMFKEGKAVCFIDTDTIMPGSVYDDLADCARSCCIDEKGCLDRERLIFLLRGYVDGCKNRILTADTELLIKYIEKNRFVLGLRYYTDHLSGEGYFAEQYSGQNADKAKRLLTSFL